MYSQTDLTKLDECLACGSTTDLSLLMDFGDQPPANAFKADINEKIDAYPLAINRCNNCNHVQLTHIVDPRILYKNYQYVSGTALTMHKYFDWFVRYSVDTMTMMGNNVAPDAKILDIGCNDGSQLDAFKRYSPRLQTHGVDPAANIVAVVRARHQTKVGYFDEKYVESAKESSSTSDFDMIVAQNVFAHNPDPVNFLKNAAELLSDNGLLFIQTSQADMFKNGEFDTVYHEHISYFCIRSMHELSKRVKGLYLVDVTKSPLHGNSYIFVFSKNPSKYSVARMINMIVMEEANGYSGKVSLDEFSKKCKTIIDSAKSISTQGLVVGYGAAAKAMTFINVSGIHLDMILDDSPLKQEKYTAAGGIPIVDPHRAMAMIPDNSTFVILAWNFYDEIVGKIKKARPNSNDIFVKFFGNG